MKNNASFVNERKDNKQDVVKGKGKRLEVKFFDDNGNILFKSSESYKDIEDYKNGFLFAAVDEAINKCFCQKIKGHADQSKKGQPVHFESLSDSLEHLKEQKGAVSKTCSCNEHCKSHEADDDKEAFSAEEFARAFIETMQFFEDIFNSKIDDDLIIKNPRFKNKKPHIEYGPKIKKVPGGIIVSF